MRAGNWIRRSARSEYHPGTWIAKRDSLPLLLAEQKCVAIIGIQTSDPIAGRYSTGLPLRSSALCCAYTSASSMVAAPFVAMPDCVNFGVVASSLITSFFIGNDLLVNSISHLFWE